VSRPEESTGTKNAREIRRVLSEITRAKVSPWLAIGISVFPIVASAIGIVWSASRFSSRMDRFSSDVSKLTGEISLLRGDIKEIRGAQSSQALEVVELKAAIERLRERGKEDRELVAKLQYQMSYRLQFEASVRSLHTDHPWP
jgi:outer membrane murein-binding lipoprotein Lpp